MFSMIKKAILISGFFMTVVLTGSEFFTDPGFESGNCSWNSLKFRYDTALKPAWQAITDGTTGMRVQTKMTHNGKHALAIFNKTPRGYIRLLPPAIPVSEGKRYRLSYFVYNDSPSQSSIVTDLYFDNADGNQVWRHVREFSAFSIRKGEWLPVELRFEIPRTGAKRMRICIQASGEKLCAFLDDFSFQEIPGEEITGRYDAARELPAMPGLRLWSDIIQVQTPCKEMPQGLPGTSAIRLSAASNEREFMQLILHPESDLYDVRISGLPLIGPNGKRIESDAYSFQRIGYLDIPASAGPKAGMRPDPLFRETTFKAPGKCNTPILLSIDVPKNTAKGIYNSKIIIETGAKRHEIPLELKVRSFELPDIATLKTFFYARYEEFCKFDRRPASEVIDAIHDILRAHRINGNQGQTLPMPEYKLKNGRLTITGFEAFDRYVQRRIERDGMRIFPMPYLYFFGDTGGFYKGRDRVFGNVAYNSPEGKRYLADFARQMQHHVKEKFPQAEFLAYIWDEPRYDNIRELSSLLKSIRAGSPDMTIFLPAPLHFAVNYPEVNIWCDPFQPFFNPAFHAALPKARFWIYNWPASLAPTEYFQARLYPMLAYFNNAEGALIWQIFDASPNRNPWTDLVKTYNCGSATLVYPPQKPGDTFHSSQRFAVIREGIDDYDYMKLLEKRVETSAPGKGSAYVKALLAPMFKGNKLEYHNNPALLSRLRDRLGDALDAPELDRKLLNHL